MADGLLNPLGMVNIMENNSANSDSSSDSSLEKEEDFSNGTPQPSALGDLLRSDYAERHIPEGDQVIFYEPPCERHCQYLNPQRMELWGHVQPDYNALFIDLCIHGDTMSRNITRRTILEKADLNYREPGINATGFFLAVLNGKSAKFHHL